MMTTDYATLAKLPTPELRTLAKQLRVHNANHAPRHTLLTAVRQLPQPVRPEPFQSLI
jgi:hypothetical protein